MPLLILYLLILVVFSILFFKKNINNPKKVQNLSLYFLSILLQFIALVTMYIEAVNADNTGGTGNIFGNNLINSLLVLGVSILVYALWNAWTFKNLL